jgi:glyoxylase-like metal-dependent hydrolase (beta-lactamase superfamily II)
MAGQEIIFEQIRSSGCLSYFLGCKRDKVALVIDPEEAKIEEYLGLAEFFDTKLLYAIDTHTHADHVSACKMLRDSADVKVVMHRATDAPYVDLKVNDGDAIRCGTVELRVIHTPGHTEDGMCLLAGERLFTGDTLLIGGCGRTDLPGGDAEKQFESLRKLAALGDTIQVFPAHDYRLAASTIGEERKSNARMLIAAKEEFVRFMTSRKPPLPRKFQKSLEENRSPSHGTQRGLGEGI